MPAHAGCPSPRCLRFLTAVLLCGLSLAAPVAAEDSPAAPEGRAGEPANGLTFVLTMDQSRIGEGEDWTGRLECVNSGASPVRVFPGFALDIRLTRRDGKKAEATRYIGSGIFDPDEERKSVAVVPPAGRLVLATFSEQNEPYSSLGGFGGRAHFAWRLTAGDYDLTIGCASNDAFLDRLDLTDVWRGSGASGTASVRVSAREIDAPVVDGLQLILETQTDTTRNDPMTRKTGRMRFRNVSDHPIIVDAGARLVVEVTKADGTKTPASPVVLEREMRQRRQDFITLQPGESLWMWKFSATMMGVEGIPRMVLDPGEYRFVGRYECARDESAAHGAGGPAWTGTLQSNTAKVFVP